MSQRRGNNQLRGGNSLSLSGLDDTHRLYVKQHVEMFEAITGWEGANSYTVLNERGAHAFNVQEESGACARQCCKSNRAFTLHVCDDKNEEVIRIERPLRFFWQEILVWDVRGSSGAESGGVVLGKVQKTIAFFSRTFKVIDVAGTHLFDISSPLFSPWTFNLYDVRRDGKPQIGAVKKEWSGLAQELLTDADNFGIEFPASLPQTSKALLMAAVFLIDFMVRNFALPLPDAAHAHGHTL
jgi:hypothetical protein